MSKFRPQTTKSTVRLYHDLAGGLHRHDVVVDGGQEGDELTRGGSFGSRGAFSSHGADASWGVGGFLEVAVFGVLDDGGVFALKKKTKLKTGARL